MLPLIRMLSSERTQTSSQDFRSISLAEGAFRHAQVAGTTAY
jgi:hypothetical protein